MYTTKYGHIGYLTENSKKVLRTNKPIEGTSSTTTKLTPIELLKKYETAIKDEFGSTTTIEEEQNEEKDTNRNLMLKLAICNMCYIDEYTCAFKEYYYKGAYSIEESKEIRKLYYLSSVYNIYYNILLLLSSLIHVSSFHVKADLIGLVGWGCAD